MSTKDVSLTSPHITLSVSILFSVVTKVRLGSSQLGWAWGLGMFILR